MSIDKASRHFSPMYDLDLFIPRRKGSKRPISSLQASSSTFPLIIPAYSPIFRPQYPIVMATIRNGRISTSFNHNKIKVIPELGLPALNRSHSATVASVSSVTSSLRETREMSKAEPCFITRQNGYSLEKAHLVNAVRNNPTLKSEIVSDLIPFQ